MTETELNERISALEAKKKGLERNRNICVMLTALLGYNVWTSIREGVPPLWFYFAMGAILAAVIAVGVYGHIRAADAGKKIAALLYERENTTPVSRSAGDIAEDGGSDA